MAIVKNFDYMNLNGKDKSRKNRANGVYYSQSS
jgi:hypothetical protein